ncbi:YajQ family cyclic di-GMP-binding protein [candidate division Kazan bacterium RIFCSPHIGHO2_01_FULL_49_10]|uniref:Nucleotide-binding protein A2994_03560 n=1 Tax=candidate division Kazan bacterium RIFCSPLOWO2_01_FULL_48_13 TaxID=1798539 RepID=A0A1F4PQ82_UNCK3|nr:MAG: YajQ family cyclic di-GMP-binding protein [candidate division Kazan bacterium RIFCSPHIGHO2_01_FULL_49_10]OGB85202.1 MAG: YajQ family cyclic di-GMP-binding protein [candidate division Kazan bacterium RIFCSPLOWO2_01_FULL_48_13]
MEYSFDVVSKIDQQELANALDQARREIVARYDFKNVLVDIKVADGVLTIHTTDEYKFTAVLEIIKSKFIRRGIDLKILGEEKREDAANSTLRVTIKLVEGISGDYAKTINKLIRDHFPKIKSSIQGEELRVSSKSKDDLQAVMQLLKSDPEIKLPLQFTNYR